MSYLQAQLSRLGKPGFDSYSLALVLVMVLLPSAHPVAAQLQSAQPWTVESYGRVLAMGRIDSTLYIGGNFRMVGPSTGQGVPVSLEDGKPHAKYPKVLGEILAAVADGEGGWFIGGDFIGVGGLPRCNLAHILPDGSVSPWAPDPDLTARALVLKEDRLYVAGGFATIAGLPRRGVASFEIPSGRLTSWNPDAAGGVYALAVHGHSVYLGGPFRYVGGQPRSYLAEVDARTGRVTDWNPSADHEVRALAVDGNTIYAGGYFRRVGGEDHPLLVALDRATGIPLPWRWKLERIPEWNQYDSGPYVGVLVPHGNTLYFGGSFTHVDSVPHGGVAALDLHTHSLTRWDAHLVNYGAPSPYCYALTVRDRAVYIGGSFYRIGPVVQRLNVGAVDVGTGDLLPWYPKPNAAVHALAASDDAIYLGGDFSSLWSWQPRNCLAAVDAATGQLLPWNPNPNGLVDHMLVSGKTVYVSGDFDDIAGQARRQIAALDAMSGAPTSWNPGVPGYLSQAVYAMVLARGTLYVGGYFGEAGGQPRENLAAIDSATGRATAWNPGADDIVSALALRGDTLYAGGWFRNIGGRSQPELAAFDIVSGTLLSWRVAPPYRGDVTSLAVGDQALYVGGLFSDIGGAYREGLAALNLDSGAVLPWRADATDRVLTVAVNGGVLYAAGWFNNVRGKERNGVAAIDGKTGVVLPWNPAVKSQDQFPPVVWALLPWQNTIYLGGDFRGVGLTPCGGLAWLSESDPYVPDPVTAVPNWPSGGLLAEVRPNPTHSSAVIRYALPSRVAVSLTVYDLQGRWVTTLMDHELQDAGEHERQLQAEGWLPGCYFCRLDAGTESTTRKVLVLR
jgi:hypothetical protein